MASSLPCSARRAFQKESSCPICLEEYVVPKSLPCLHNICKNCLFDIIQRIRKNPQVLRCPICRKECPVPERDVDGFPTNEFLVKVLENSPVKKAKAEIRTVLEECKLKNKDLIQIIEKVESALTREGDSVKQDIHEAVENLIDVLRKQENTLCHDVDRVVEKAKRSQPAVTLMSQTEILVQNVEDTLELQEGDAILNDQDVIMKRLKESTSACSKLTHLYFGVEPQKANLQFTKNREFIQRVSGEMFGEVNQGNDLSSENPASSELDRLELLQAGSRFRTLSVPKRLEKKFKPFAISISEEHKIAVVDQGNHSVLLYSKHGEFLTQLGHRGSNDGELECPAGAAFLSRHILVITDGCLFGNPSRIQAFDSDGRFIRCITKLTENSYWFTHLARVSNEEFLVTCRKISQGKESCVKLFNTEGIELFSLGSMEEPEFMNPVKAVYLNEEFFVSDFDTEQNRCSVKAFDRNGTYVRSFGECMLKQDPSEHPFYPLAIAADSHGDAILAYSGLYKLVRSYRKDGSLESYYSTIAGISDLAVTNDGRAFVTCDGIGEFAHSVQVLFHF